MAPKFRRLLRLFVWNLLISIAVSCIIWKFALGRNFNIGSGYVEIDFLNILGIVFTITGLVYTLFQIAELPTRAELIEKTTTEVNKQNFRWVAIERCLAIKEAIQTLQRRINTEPLFSEDVLNGYIITLQDSLNSLNTILIYQKGLASGPIIDCNNCVTLLKEIRDDAYRVIEERSYPSFKKQTFNAKVESFLHMIIQHEAVLKS
jgi:hypothetical protein